MSYYKVYYQNFQGEKVKEYFQFAHITHLINFLQRQKLKVFKIKKVAKIFVNIENFFSKNICDEEIIEVINHLYVIVKAGLPLHQSIEDLALQSNNPKLKKILFAISERIEIGHTLSSSLELFHKNFRFSTIYFLRIGEETGTLQETLLKAKNFLIQNSKLKKEIKLAMIYPLTIFSTTFIAILLWFVFVLPQMVEMFEQMQIKLPLATQILISISNFINSTYEYFFLIFILLILAFWYGYKRSDKIHMKITKVVLKLPFIGNIIKEINIAYITEFLHLTLSTGTSLFHAIGVISDNIPNIIYKQSIKKVQKYLQEGDSLSIALQKEKIYTLFMIRVLNVGEQSGNLESQLYTISRYYQQRVQTSTTRITKVLEPVSVIFIGAIFALIMVGLMGPLFDIVASI